MRVKNNKETSDIWAGMTIEAAAEYDLQASEISTWKSNDKVIQDLSTLSLLIGDGVTYKSTGAEAVNYLLGTQQDVYVQQNPSFTSKKVGNKNLYIRATGKTFDVEVGENNLDFLIPYNQVKFNGLQIINGLVGEVVSLKILDTSTGTISGVPNYVLNQFGYTVNLPNGEFIRESKYDADLYLNMVVRVVLTAIEARTFRINYLIHELK